MPPRITSYILSVDIRVTSCRLSDVAFDPKVYMAPYMQKRRTERRAFIFERLGGECANCGSKDRLEVDHIDPTIKKWDVARAQFLDGPLDRILEEIAKCQLLCHDCHVAKSKKNRDFGGGHNKVIDPQHGTAVMYTKKCKCSECREWKRRYRVKEVDSLGRPRTILG